MAESHGNSVAAWTGVLVLLVATLLICLGIIFGRSLLWIPGIVLVVVGIAAWVALDKAGYGEGGHRSKGATAAR